MCCFWAWVWAWRRTDNLIYNRHGEKNALSRWTKPLNAAGTGPNRWRLSLWRRRLGALQGLLLMKQMKPLPRQAWAATGIAGCLGTNKFLLLSTKHTSIIPPLFRLKWHTIFRNQTWHPKWKVQVHITSYWYNMIFFQHPWEPTTFIFWGYNP